MRFDIAKSLNGDNIIYIARDTGGIVRLRAESLEAIQEAIKHYNEQAALEAQRAKSQAKKSEEVLEETSNETPGEEGTDTILSSEEKENQSSPEEVVTEKVAEPLVVTHTPDVILEATVPDNEESQKRYVHEVIEEKKKPSGKKSFWDKLK